MNNDVDGKAADGKEVEEEEDVECMETNGGGDMRFMRKLHDPKLPSRAEVDAHNLTHLPFRSWCRHCVRGRGQEESHRKCEAREGDGVPEIHFDFAFPGSHGQEGLTLLVARERDSKMLLSTPLPTKGTTGQFGVKRFMTFLKEI